MTGEPTTRPDSTAKVTGSPVIGSTDLFDDSMVRLIQCLVKYRLQVRRIPALPILPQIHPQLAQTLLVASPSLDQVRNLVDGLPEVINLPAGNILGQGPVPRRVGGNMHNPKGCSENWLWRERTTHARSSNVPVLPRGARSVAASLTRRTTTGC